MSKHLLLCVSIAIGIGRAAPAWADEQAVRPSAQTDEAAALLEALKDKDPSVRLQAAQLLAEMGETRATLPALVELLKTPERSVRLQAAHLLKELGSARLRAAVPALIAVLKEGDSEARLYAAQFLAPMQAGARAAAPTLVKILKEEPWADVRTEALRASLADGPDRGAYRPSRRRRSADR